MTAPALARSWPKRFSVIGLCFLSTFICYLDRVNISVAIIPMAAELGWSLSTQGVVLSAFFYGYLATQVLGGWLADRHGGKLVLGIAVLWWSLFTLLTPPVAGSLALLFAVRVALGMGEGVGFPATYSIIARWIPLPERTRSIALIGSGIPLGTVAALLACPWIVERLGWPAAFYSFGLLGFFWYAVWQARISDDPASHPRIAAREREFILANRPALDGVARVSWGRLLAHRATWAVIIAHFANNWGIYVILNWLPTYFVRELGVDVAELGLYTVIPWLTMFAMNNAVGWIADWLLGRGLGVTRVRKLMQGVGFAGPAIFLLAIGVGGVSSPAQATLYIAGALGLGAFSLAGYGVNHLDIGPRYAGILLGFSNTAGTIPGIVGVALTGWILDATGSWTAVFALAAGVYALGLACWLAMASGERVFD
jgi:ACS family sodium-dependent inorganic phosphate cotransporter